MAKGLTKRQQAILDFILEYVREQGYPPSIREIGAKFDIGSLRGVTVHLDALDRKGYITRTNTPRSIKVVHPMYQTATNVVMLPLFSGAIAAGYGSEMDSHVEDMIAVPSGMVRNIESAYLLRVTGESMTGEGIFPRDLVIVKPQVEANNGDLVACRFGDEATVKRLHKGAKGYTLIPSNPSFEPIEVGDETFGILGKVVGLIRDYSGMAF